MQKKGRLRLLVGVLSLLLGGLGLWWPVSAQALTVSEVNPGQIFKLGNRNFVKLENDADGNAYLIQTTVETSNPWAPSANAALTDYNQYLGSLAYGVGYYLNNQYTYSLTNAGLDLDYLVKKDWDLGVAATDSQTYFSLISVDEWSSTNIRNVFISKISLPSGAYWWTRTTENATNVKFIGGTTTSIYSTAANTSYQVRPVVYLRGDLKIEAGLGTEANPLIVYDENLTRPDSCRHSVNQDRVGCLPATSIVKLGNRNFAKLNTTVKGYEEDAFLIQTTAETSNRWSANNNATLGAFNQYIGSLTYGSGYYLKHQYTNSMVNAGLDLDYLVKKDWDLGAAATDSQTYFSLISSDEWTAANIRDTFANSINLSSGVYWWTRTINSSANTEFLGGTTTSIYNTTVNTSYQVRPVVYLRGDLKIEAGLGTNVNPYVVYDPDIIDSTSCRHSVNQDRVGCLPATSIVKLGNRNFAKLNTTVKGYEEDAFLIQTTAETSNRWSANNNATLGAFNQYLSSTVYGIGYFLKNQYTTSIMNAGLDLNYLVKKNWDLGASFTDSQTYFSLISSDEWTAANIRDTFANSINLSSGVYWWTRTINSSANTEFLGGTTTSIYNTTVNTSYQVRPVTYLRGELKHTSGVGTETDPFIIEDPPPDAGLLVLTTNASSSDGIKIGGKVTGNVASQTMVVWADACNTDGQCRRQTVTVNAGDPIEEQTFSLAWPALNLPTGNYDGTIWVGLKASNQTYFGESEQINLTLGEMNNSINLTVIEDQNFNIKLGSNNRLYLTPGTVSGVTVTIDEAGQAWASGVLGAGQTLTFGETSLIFEVAPLPLSQVKNLVLY